MVQSKEKEKVKPAKQEEVNSLPLVQHAIQHKFSSVLFDRRSELVTQQKLQKTINDSPYLASIKKATEKISTKGNAEQKNNLKSGESIQFKKTGPFDLQKVNLPKIGFRHSEYKELGNEEKNTYIYTKLKETYDEKLKKGTKYWNDLQNSIAQYNKRDNNLFIEKLKKKHLDYDDRFSKNYFTKGNNGGSVDDFEVSSTGLRANENKISEADKGKDTPYSNSVNFKDRSISVNHVYADRDLARQSDAENKENLEHKPRGLPNSEILWQQYKWAIEQHVKTDSEKQNLKRDLNALKWRQVATPETHRVILFALPDGKNNTQESHVWKPASEEFLALLGTVNCSGAAHMLADHVDELNGKSITEIELLGGKDVNIDIKIGHASQTSTKLGAIGGAVSSLLGYFLGGLTLGPAVGIGILAGLGIYGGSKLLGY